MRPVHRVSRFLAVGAIALMAACTSAPKSASAPAGSAPAQPNVPTMLLVTYANLIPDHLPLWIAKDGGIFDQHGLDVELQMVQSSAEMPAMLSGQTQFNEGGGSQVLSAAAAGGDVLVVATNTPVYPFVFEVPASIQTPDDLRGKTVGVSGVGTSSDIAARMALKQMGLDPGRDLNIITVGSSQNRRAAMVAGNIQGGVAQPPDSLQLEALGFHPLYNLASSGVKTATDVTVVPKSYAGTHRDVVQAYVDSLVQAIARMKQDQAFSVEVLGNHLQYDNQDDLVNTWRFYAQDVAPSSPSVSADQFDDAKQVLAADNPAIASFDVTTIFDNSFVQSAADRGLAKAQ